MQVRLGKRTAAVLGLAVMAASAPFLLSSGAASADNPTIRASAQYGCADGGFVEVTLQDPQASDAGTQYLVGLAGPGADIPATFPDLEGPSLVTVGTDRVTVRLAGVAHDGDHIFISEQDNNALQVIPLNACKSSKPPTISTLKTATLAVGPNDQCGPSTTTVAATLLNPNSVSYKYISQTGLNSVDYTLILVQSQTGAFTDAGALKFDSRGNDAVCLSAGASAVDSFVVKAIGVDGSVVPSKEITLGTTKQSSKPPTSPPPSSPHPSGSHPSSPAPSTSTSVATSGSVTFGNPGPNGGGSVDFPVTDPASSSNNTGTTATTSTSSSGPRATSTSVPSSSASATAAIPISADPRFRTLAEPPLDTHSRIFVWQRDAALIVLIDALAIGALIGGVLWSAKRR
ncbi:hypothetical protein BH10ACT8_BH10ACT8_29500 [soil metagenome]